MLLLATTNRYLFVLSVADVMEGVPDHKRELFRLLTACERLTLQSFRADNVLTLGTHLALKATGNAYPPVLILVVLQPLLMAVATACSSSGFDLMSWPPPELPDMLEPSVLKELAASLRARGRIVHKRKFETWKNGNKKRPRALSDGSG